MICPSNVHISSPRWFFTIFGARSRHGEAR
jgi:hypothetical protein